MTTTHPRRVLDVPRARMSLGPDPVVMGILNITPDSFSDGGQIGSAADAVGRARTMAADGADILDIGGESTRPGAEEIGAQAELDRIMPVFDALAASDVDVPLSIDTYKAVVADQAVQAGARIINDVYGLQREPEMADVAALHRVPVIIMHWDTGRDRDKDIIAEVMRYFGKSLELAENAGIPKDRIVLDPGFGFAKGLEENYTLLNRLGELHALGYPLLAGTSRKSMIGKLLDVAAQERLAGTIATNVLAYRAGAHIFRVHDVHAHDHALRVARASLYGVPQEAE